MTDRQHIIDALKARAWVEQLQEGFSVLFLNDAVDTCEWLIAEAVTEAKESKFAVLMADNDRLEAELVAAKEVIEAARDAASGEHTGQFADLTRRDLRAALARWDERNQT
jgi:hypothetical protein